MKEEELLKRIHAHYKKGDYKIEQKIVSGGERVYISRPLMSDAFLIDMMMFFSSRQLHYLMFSENDTPVIAVLTSLKK